MRIIDLTRMIEEKMPVYPGTLGPSLEVANTHEKDGFKETYLKMYSHTGTHVDAPAHIIKGAKTLDEFDISQFIGKAIVINCKELKEGEAITMQHLAPYQDKLSKVDFLLFNLGYDKYWGTDTYYGDFPCINDEVLDFIIHSKYKGIGFDVISLDPMNNLSRHNKLFKVKDILNIENLKNLDLCGNDIFNFSCFPLKFKDSDGAPIRAVAWFD